MDAFTTFIQREIEDTKEFSRIGTKIYIQTSTDVASGGTGGAGNISK